MFMFLVCISVLNIIMPSYFFASEDPSMNDDGSHNPNVATCWRGDDNGGNENDNREKKIKVSFYNDTPEFKGLIFQAKREKDAKLFKIICADPKTLVDALVPYAAQQIQEQLQRNNQEMLSDAWYVLGIQRALDKRDITVLTCLSYQKDGLVELSENGAVKTFNQDAIVQYLTKETGLCERAYEKAITGYSNEERKKLQHIQFGEAVIINAWWDDFKYVKPESAPILERKLEVEVPLDWKSKQNEYFALQKRLCEEQEKYFKIYDTTGLEQQRDSVAIFIYGMTNIYAYYMDSNTEHNYIINKIYTHHDQFIALFKELDVQRDKEDISKSDQELKQEKILKLKNMLDALKIRDRVQAEKNSIKLWAADRVFSYELGLKEVMDNLLMGHPDYKEQFNTLVLMNKTVKDEDFYVFYPESSPSVSWFYPKTLIRFFRCIYERFVTRSTPQQKLQKSWSEFYEKQKTVIDGVFQTDDATVSKALHKRFDELKQKNKRLKLHELALAIDQCQKTTESKCRAKETSGKICGKRWWDQLCNRNFPQLVNALKPLDKNSEEYTSLNAVIQAVNTVIELLPTDTQALIKRCIKKD